MDIFLKGLVQNSNACLSYFREKKKYTSTYKFVAKVIKQVSYYHETPEKPQG